MYEYCNFLIRIAYEYEEKKSLRMSVQYEKIIKKKINREIFFSSFPNQCTVLTTELKARLIRQRIKSMMRIEMYTIQ